MSNFFNNRFFSNFICILFPYINYYLTPLKFEYKFQFLYKFKFFIKVLIIQLIKSLLMIPSFQYIISQVRFLKNNNNNIQSIKIVLIFFFSFNFYHNFRYGCIVFYIIMRFILRFVKDQLQINFQSAPSQQVKPATNQSYFNSYYISQLSK